MKDFTLNNQNSSNDLYRKIMGPILQKDDGLDPESLSKSALSLLHFISLNRSKPIISCLLKRLEEKLLVKDQRLKQQLFGCHFPNPIGLAAGFDKDGVAAGIWNQFGFGFAELGTVTWHAQAGNPKPRLFRLATEQAALNRMGFNNLGAKKLKDTLISQKIEVPGLRPYVIGLNIGKSKITPLEEASEDYLSSLKVVAPLADYVVINVSSPNTPGLRSLQEVKELNKLVHKLKTIENCPPLFLKIAPDLSDNAIDQIADASKKHSLAGIIATNTSLNRHGLENRIITTTRRKLSEELGGLSGAPIQSRALEVIRRLRKKANDDLILIGVGGIDSDKSAWERIAAGASLIQIYTSWIYNGPELVPHILNGLITQLDKNGFKNIREAIGCKEPWK